MPDLADLFPGFASEWISTAGGRIFARVGGRNLLGSQQFLRDQAVNHGFCHDPTADECDAFILEWHAALSSLFEEPADDHFKTGNDLTTCQLILTT